MLNEISLKNARNFSGKFWKFKLSSLTVFCGTNSAGKSTVLKSLMLLNQSLDNKFLDFTKPVRLHFSGKSVDLGDYKAFISGNDSSKELSIKLTSVARFRKPYFDKDLEKTLQPAAAKKINKYLSSENKPQYSLCTSLLFTGKDEKKSEHGILKYAQFIIKLCNIEIASFSVSRISDMQFDNKANLIKRFTYMISIHSSIFSAFGGDRVVRPLNTDDSGNHYFIAYMGELFPRGLLGLPLEGKYTIKKDETSFNFAPLPPLIQDAINQITKSIEQIHYLGPLRAPGKRYYVLDKDTQVDLDHIGDFLPYILRDRIDSKINFPLADNINHSSPSSLRQLLNSWLHYLRVGELNAPNRAREIDTEYHRDILGELKIIGASGKSYALADSGFGFSQVLPIITRGILSERDSMFIVEQPELHLHPALQVRLARFFVAMALSGRKVILETHSEHLVNAFRVLAVEHTTPDISKIMNITYLTSSESKPNVVDLSIGEDGSVPGWPPSFFGEALDLAGRLLRAQKMRRQKAPN